MACMQQEMEKTVHTVPIFVVKYFFTEKFLSQVIYTTGMQMECSFKCYKTFSLELKL